MRYTAKDLASVLLFISRTWTTRRSGWEDRGSKLAQSAGEHLLQVTVFHLLGWAMFGGSPDLAIRKALTAALHDADEVGLIRDKTPYSQSHLRNHKKGRADFFEREVWPKVSDEELYQHYLEKRQHLLVQMKTQEVTPRGQKLLLKFWDEHNDPRNKGQLSQELHLNHAIGDAAQAVVEPTKFSARGFVDEALKKANAGRARKVVRQIEREYQTRERA